MGFQVVLTLNPTRQFFYLTLLSLITISPVLSATTHVWIYSGNGLKIRTAPDSKSESLGILPYGTKLKLLGNHKGDWLEIKGIKAKWAKVETEDGRKGFMFAGFLLPVKTPPLANDSHPILSWHQSLKGPDQSLNFSDDKRQVELTNLKNKSAFLIFRTLYQIPDEIPFPSKFRNLYLHSDVLNKGAKHWKIHELRVTRKKEYEIEKISYQLKSQSGTLTGTLIFGSKQTIEEQFELAANDQNRQKISEQTNPPPSDHSPDKAEPENPTPQSTNHAPGQDSAKP